MREHGTGLQPSKALGALFLGRVPQAGMAARRWRWGKDDGLRRFR